MSSLLHVVDGLVEHVERPVRRRERREDGAAQLQAAGNCLKINLPGKLILSKRKEVLFS